MQFFQPGPWGWPVAAPAVPPAGNNDNDDVEDAGAGASVRFSRSIKVCEKIGKGVMIRGISRAADVNAHASPTMNRLSESFACS